VILDSETVPGQIPPEPPTLTDPGEVLSQRVPSLREGRVDLLSQFVPAPRAIRHDPAIDAGLPEGARYLPLTLKRTYALAMIRDLKPEVFEEDRSALIDPNRLDALSKEVGGDDFGRFRVWFLDRRLPHLDDGTSETVDVGAQFLDVLARSWEVGSARRITASYEMTLSLYSRYAEAGASTGIEQAQVDRIDAQLQESRTELDRRLLRFQNALDRLKVDLGLPPDAPVVPVDDLLVGFREIFESVAKLEAMPESEPTDLTAICDRFPDLYDVRIGSSSLRGASEESQRLSGLMSDVRKRLAERGELSGKQGNRQLLQAREIVRALAEIPREYSTHRHAFLLAARHRRLLLAAIIAPPESGAVGAGAANSQASMTLDFVISSSGVQIALERTVRTWVDYQLRRVKAYRTLGELPFDDWAGFLSSFKATASPAEDVDRQSEPPKEPVPPPNLSPPPQPPQNEAGIPRAR
jgi:hypothetical protein